MSVNFIQDLDTIFIQILLNLTITSLNLNQVFENVKSFFYRYEYEFKENKAKRVSFESKLEKC